MTQSASALAVLAIFTCMVANTAAAAPTIVANTQTQAEADVADADHPAQAASQFVAHINYARVAIAMKDYPLAQTHIEQAQDSLSVLRQASLEGKKVVQVESGRVVYAYDTNYKTHYFPVERPVEVKKVTKGPFWARGNTLAVTDADVVYLTLDLSGDKPEKGLAKAMQALSQDYVSDADKDLAKLSDQVVKVERKRSLPQEVARDNIALARDFVAMDNYSGARFALKHAAVALDEFEKQQPAGEKREQVVTMHKEVGALQEQVAKGDPGLLAKADAQMEGWWTRLRNWTN